MAPRTQLDERFATGELDPDVWLPYYLPHWATRAGSAATWGIGAEGLVLRIPAEQGLWAPDQHAEPLRVSGIQSGERDGQQPFLALQQVREPQPEFWGFTPHYGHVEVRMRMRLSPRSMAAFWLAGVERNRGESGEICVAEIFGDTITDGPSAAVGIGVKAFADPALTQDFTAVRMPLDVSVFHTYAVDWTPGALRFTVDGVEVRRLGQSPDYPVQLMLAVFDFPAKAAPGDDLEPELVVSHVRGASTR
ncbi:glycoside hydrolase family 16 protein [Pseudonocardia sp. CA-107938]|uniref:glycoside hydrolase family 16 protein n=1 Tax=Pseudonocardia sp. CA-107938 TaxID=3240021 RepID=UPI003D94EEF3